MYTGAPGTLTNTSVEIQITHCSVGDSTLAPFFNLCQRQVWPTSKANTKANQWEKKEKQDTQRNKDSLRYSYSTSIVNTTGLCWLDWLHSLATLCKWQQSMLHGGTGPYSDPALTVETLQDGEWCGLHLVHSHCVCSCTVPGPVSATPGVIQLKIYIFLKCIVFKKWKDCSTSSVSW